MDDLLNKLIGRWSLTGKMGDTALYQEVNTKWALQDLFVEMRLSPIRVGESGNPDYEALYLVGHDKKTSKYVLHLFDTFGVTSKPVPGIGVRKDNSFASNSTMRSDPGPTHSPGTPIGDLGRTASPTNIKMETREPSRRKNSLLASEPSREMRKKQVV